MKKRNILLTVALSLLIVFILCIASWKFTMNHFSQDWTPVTIPEFDDIEMFSYLDSHVGKDSTLTEIVAAFEAMCRIPYETYFDTYRLEAHTYEYNGEKQFILTLSYQFQTNWYIDFVDIGVDICYEADDELEKYDYVIFFEGDFEELVRYLLKSELYEDLLDREIIDCVPFGMLW